jgi:hypothetical protein
MATVAEVVRRFDGAYLERFGAKIPAAHKKVLGAIAAYRTGELGLVLYQCACCGQMQAMGRSCGDRHCPSCQRDKAEAWLEKHTNRLLPCPYFLVSFTLPATLRKFACSRQRVVCSALFEASSAACAPWQPIASISAAIAWASSVSYTPGAAPWSITPTCTA